MFLESPRSALSLFSPTSSLAHCDESITEWKYTNGLRQVAYACPAGGVGAGIGAPPSAAPRAGCPHAPSTPPAAPSSIPSMYARQVKCLALSCPASVRVELGYTQPWPVTCSSAPTVPGVRSSYVGQFCAVCGVGPWPLSSAIPFANCSCATA